MSIPAGWYPNPDGTPTRRWWDGSSWGSQVTDQPVAQPYAAVAAPRAPGGTSAATVPFWIFALTPLLTLLSFAVWNVQAYAELTVTSSSDPTALVDGIAGTGYYNIFFIGVLGYLVSLILAAVDRSVLRQRGVPRPFHWAWGLFSPLVYLIGRPIVCARRGARGSRGAVIVYVVSYVLVTVLVSVVTAVAIANAFADLGYAS